MGKTKRSCGYVMHPSGFTEQAVGYRGEIWAGDTNWEVIRIFGGIKAQDELTEGGK